MNTSAIPPLPQGYTLDASSSVPSLPEGYTLDKEPAQQGGGKDDTGVLASLKRTGSSLVHLPGAIYDAFTKPPQNDEEKQTLALSGPGGLGLKRIIADPMIAQHIKAEQIRQAGGDPHMANMHDIASVVPVIGPMAGDITERYLNGDKSGAVTDLATAVAGPKIAEGVTNAALSGVSKLANKALPFAERTYQSALKPSTTLSPAERASVVRTGLDVGIPVTDKGVTKLQGLIDNLNDAVKQEIAKNPTAPINKFNVASRLSETAKTFANQVAPTRDLNAISEVGNDFLANQPGNITAQDAQALKTGTYQRLSSRAYGEAGSATTEAEKSLARGLKEEIENYFPEVKGMNAQTSKFYGLQEELTRAVNRVRNHNLLGLGPTTAATAGAAAGAMAGHPLSAATGGLIVKAIMDDPAFKSKLAIAISKTGKVPPAVAFSRIGSFTNALAQSLDAGASQAPASSQ